MRTLFGYTMLGDILLGSFKTKRNFHDLWGAPMCMKIIRYFHTKE
ncbi:MAG: hypothetical protein KFBDDELM_00154 [Candidatus Argoarchaeum ethanivorans]|uniref:Uncharacterized protein n=1 Tax=Candidatus Argoarchaeum ethanivorans TaxID=2608793 RepID=A0A811T032_9EURY|nr:MAG: hypothetical protein KFBDDELM_00154 [Candidatus Argoarchaeum ethanivorans]